MKQRTAALLLCVGALTPTVLAGCDLSWWPQPPDVDWVRLPGGCFMMGCELDLLGCEHAPFHEVCVSEFYIMPTEFTIKQLGVDTYADSYGIKVDCPDCPASVEWHTAEAQCSLVGGRLPTEAEWEYAARGGTTGPFYCGEDVECLYDHEWLKENSGKRYHPVGLLKPNPFGLYDMLGNESERTGDWYSDDYYSSGEQDNPKGPEAGVYSVVRGRHAFWSASAVDVGQRWYYGDSDRAGFRCVRDVVKRQQN